MMPHRIVPGVKHACLILTNITTMPLATPTAIPTATLARNIHCSIHRNIHHNTHRNKRTLAACGPHRRPQPGRPEAEGEAADPGPGL